MNRTTWMMNTKTQDRPRPQPWTLPETAWYWQTSSSSFEDLAMGFEPISLKQMDAVALLNRTDTKFVLTSAQLLESLAAVQQEYWMLSINGQRLNHYRSLYFDSADFELYNLHVNGRADRYKVRSREYTDTGLSFLEVKHKTNKGRTIKERISTPQPLAKMTSEAKNWLQGVFPFDSQALQPKLWNTFTRLTLVSKQYCERVTLDVDLTFFSGDKVLHLGGISIAEVKMDRTGCHSPFLGEMLSQRIHPMGFSKYCVGVALMNDQVKKNTLKSKLQWLDKTMKGTMHHE